MIYTITFSPAIDYVINTPQAFNASGLNRVNDYDLVPGGKGVNASIILSRLKFDNTAITFCGGPTGQLYKTLLASEQMQLQILEVATPTRINVKLRTPETGFEINGARAVITKSVLTQLINLIKTKMTQRDLVFIMGAVDATSLKTTVRTLHAIHVPFILDVDSPVVPDLLKYHPMVIKPNQDELQTYVNAKLKNASGFKQALQQLCDRGVILPIISAGSQGAYILDETGNLVQVQPPVLSNIISPVGAGDTLLAAFVGFHFLKKLPIVTALKKATALACGTVSRKWLALPQDLVKYEKLVKIIKS